MSRSEAAKLWQQRLRRFARSQMTVTQFCQSEGVSQPSFYQWKKRLRQPPGDGRPQPSDSTLQFVPLHLAGSSDTFTDENSKPLAPTVARTTIELPGGVRIRVEVPTDRQPGQPRESRT